MAKLQCIHCGAIESNRGRKFTEESLRQHILSKHANIIDIKTVPMVDMIACDDDPDGVYFALAHELSGWRF